MAGRPPRLTAAAVRFLRRWRAERLVNRKAGVPVKTLCRRYEMSSSAIWLAASRRTYKWVQP